ncbi:centrosome-associated protein 350 isoform X1 [Vidua macroura]|uniref:centrosome-associated protein 350 isoform X1 n=1 Tax=Vidua macroura TaxID=187451 RepID=UPI0023A8A54C|nr:centrosome-associated protein 350 isoform X1 [Vidua macroura]XP_053840475.1 centrosome-associated protein 350 isoform X1 [Vidua macroura]XP_053840476.1 centrosome-associated protein 350 isoform X1 [Vidua macroura]XP_053840477.1 centrosome-associated protein 350 isoform X1 [Vidua macroura]
MWSNKSNEVPLQNLRHNQSKDSTRDLTAAWASFSQTKAALRHIENKLEIAPTSTAVFDSIMDAKKPSTSASRKSSRKGSRSSSQNKSSKEKSSRSPLRATTLESNVKKCSRVEFREPLASYRDLYSSLSYHSSSQLEAKQLLSSLELSEAEGKSELPACLAREQDERDRHSRSFDSPFPSAADETVVRYLNDRPTISALQSNEAFPRVAALSRLEGEKTSGSRGDESSTRASQSITSQDSELKVSSSSAMSICSAHRLEILKQRQHDAKLEKLKERIRKQWEHSEELSGKGQHLGFAEQPVVVTNMENTVTPKVRKVTAMPAAPSYRGFNPTETRIRTPDGKIWHADEFRFSRELYRDIALQLKEDSTVKGKSSERNKEKKATRPVRKVQKLTRLSSPESKQGGNYVISASSWREGQKLVKKILGPAPRIEQDRRAVSSDRAGRERAAKSGCIGRTGSDSRLDVTRKSSSRSSERSRSKVRSETNLRKLEAALPGDNQEDHASVNKDFLPVEIRGILDDLQLDSMSTKQETDVEKQNQKSVLPTQNMRSHSPTKRKPDKVAASEEPQVISKKRHYDSDEVRQYIIRQQEERKKKQNEEKKAQKEATEQKNKRLQELYRKQKEAVTKVKNVPPPEPSAAKRLQETYSKLLLERTLLEEPPQLPTVQETQPRPGYQPSGESDKENKAQERPPSASSSSDISLSEPQLPLLRSDLMEPPWVQPDRLSPRVQLPHPQALLGSGGGPCSQHWSLEQMDLLSKECDAMLAGRRSHSAPVGSLMPQLYLNSSAAQENLIVKPSASQYKSKLDRLEALKATAASLSSRIETEAKKLAGAGINYGTMWNLEFMQENQDEGRWAKAVSPPVREENENTFSARIQRMLDACVSHTAFDDSLPGVGNLSEFKKLPETIRPLTDVISLGLRSPAANMHEGILGHLSKRQMDSPGRENQAYPLSKAVTPHESSIDSISEGPLLSDENLSEEEGGQRKQLPLKMLETLKEKDFCIRERNAFEPIKEFQKAAERYSPLFTQTSDTHSKGPWEELAKGSPHSVINIFAKNYQLHGKVFEERLNRGSALLRPLLPAMSPPESVASYEDDFASSQGSSTLTDKKISCDLSVGGSSNSSIQEEIPSRKSPLEPRSVELGSQHSSGPQSAASSRSSASYKKRGKKERLDAFNGSSHHFSVEEDKILSELERGSQQAKKSLLSSRISNKEHEQNPDTDSTLENLSGHSLMSFSDKGRPQKTPTSSPSSGSQKMLQLDSVGNTAETVKSPSGFSGGTAPGLKPNVAFPDVGLGTSRTAAGAASASGCMRFSPAGLQHRLSAELNYLSAIEESVRQLSDLERVRGISLAQQESVSLAQILKAQQQRHEQDLALWKIKAEQETLESQRQLEEAKQKAAQVHTESLQQLVQSRQEAGQEPPCMAAAKQAEPALLSIDATHQLREKHFEADKLTVFPCFCCTQMTELARDTVSAPAAPVSTLFDHQRQHHSEFMKQLRARADTNRKCESGAISQGKEETGDSKQTYSPMFDSYSESSRSKVHDQSSTSSRQESPSVPSSKENEKKLSRREKTASSIEEQAQTAADDSLPSDSVLSLPDEKDSASVATEYSLKFDESMTEDEIEEKSFRSLLPSESHRRNNLEKKRGSRDDSDEEMSPDKTALSSIKELSMPFSAGQDSFSKFTMEMVRQYMKEEEMRAAHQSSLLRLREKALKEKTKAELAWLEHQKKHLRDKGEDDKMPPIRKRQRGLLLRLQQEKAEIKRLQEANKAARKERQLILKQQAEIERIRQTTMKLQEKLKSAGENKLELPSEDDIKQSNGSSPLPTGAETRSPSPISISSSETSSIMQKLKKMRSRMDEKFLTKREQKLMQRRQHAEELLEWKRRLDAEEAEIRRMEKQALAAWDKELLKTMIAKKELGDQSAEPKETASEEESPVPSCSHLNSESSIPEDLGGLAAESVPSEPMGHGQPESPDQSTINEEMAYSEDFKSSTSPGKLSPPKSSISVSKQDSSKGSHRTGGQLHSPMKSHQTSHNWSDESLSMTQSETTSDQSDIEGRIRALKDELRKRKSVVYQLKKEQKKRQKERLKAQEASLIKQLESYDEFIKKTEAELSQDLEASPTAKPQIKTPSSTAAEKPKIKAPPLHRPETAKNWKSLTESERSRASLESVSEHVEAVPSRTERSVSVHTKKVAVTAVHAGEPSGTTSLASVLPKSSRAGSGDSSDSSSAHLKDMKDISRISLESVNKVVNAAGVGPTISHKSEITEDLEYIKSEEYESGGSNVKPVESSDVLLTLDEGRESSLDHCSENKHSQKELLDVAVESLHDTEEILEQSQSNKDAVSGPSIEETSHKLSKSAEENGDLLSQQLLSQKEPSYPEDFEGSSSRKQASSEETLPGERYRDDFEGSLLSANRESLREQSQHTQASRSRSTSLGSDGEISECLSDRSLSGSMHSGRLLELKSPTELLKNAERRDVEQEQAPACSPLWASASITEETDSLSNFNIGDRVLVSKVQPGTLRFKGLTKFAKGFWAGVELDKPEGNNNGTYDDIKYFDCREKHGIFAPPQKISHITESIDSHLDKNKDDEDSFFDDRLEKQHKAEQKDRESSKPGKEAESQSRNTTENYSQDKAPVDTAVSEASAEERVEEELSFKANSIKEISVATGSFAQEQSVVDYLKDAVKEEASHTPLTSSVVDEVSTVQLDDVSDFLSEKLERQKTLGEECAEKLDDLSPGVTEKPATPLLDLLTKEKNLLEAQLSLPLREEEKSKEQLEKVSLLTDSLLRDFVKDTVNQLQQIKKIKNEKIQLSNQELCDVKEEAITPPQQVEKQIPDGLNNFFLRSDLEDDREELSSPDMCPRPESPVFGASGQEELAKRLAELELNREFLSVLGDDQDWFDEDYGLSSRKLQQKQAEEPAVLPQAEPQKVPTKPSEEPLAVPHTAVEVEGMVHAAAEELWKLKELGHDLQSCSLKTDLCGTLQEQDTDTINKQVYRKVVFDLTREIFGEIFAEDPNLNQPIWMKPCRIASAYFRRVKDPNDLDEIKNFIAAEVLKLFSLRKEPNHKTDWQKMMKFGRKKRDRVDHILVQELHEEEAQWVNYDEDELCVKMQLADGIFEALIRDTVNVLNQINEKQRRLLLV